MDIEPLWDLGGWFFIFIDCMAATPKTPSSSSSSIVAETFAKSHSLLFLLTLFFIFLLLLNPKPTNYPMDSPNGTPSIPFKRLLLDASSNMNLHPKQTRTLGTSSSSRREFGAEAHEVPSGPNPISNRKLLSALISFHGDVSLKMKGKDTKGNEGGQLAVCRL
ncbi:hypothetical protein V6Z12_A08G220700 [Gossypium hirsutum]